MELLGVRIDQIERGDALQKAHTFLSSAGQKMIFTPNPEMLVKAYSDNYFRDILNRGNLNICDGRGIQLVAKEKIERITGVDFIIELCRLAEQENKSIFLLGSGSEEVVRKTAEKLQEQFPSLKIVGAAKGLEIHDITNASLTASPSEQEKTITTIAAVKPDILFVAFGFSKQEKWIYENLSKLPSVKIAMGVGGAFDFISGRIKRAPCWMRRAGLEWLYRLWQQPRRLGRILNATLIFLYLNRGYGKKK